MSHPLSKLLVLALFLGIPFAPVLAASRIVIEGNVIAENGIGVYVGWVGDWEIQIEANKIVRNGEGIRLKNRYAIIMRNVIRQNVVGLIVATEHQEQMVVREIAHLVLKFNAFELNELYAVWNATPFVIRAEYNWWGSPHGPVLQPGQPNALLGAIEALLWLTAPPY